ncbi:DUF6252 family protein [Solitalea sp. MAHUQ-68]|uniref:DUF6252 family protein n=1 Tax=Solitalea agri TaxID=2953739 RepID=A0A9X2EZS8_9SPHI|nr:DUF6252 family protein [Solitalea agri]MCO4291439.1 DUF6252 family protein [Solitalea agri]
MKNLFIKSLITAGFLLVLSSCQKNDDEPQETQTGANTMSCKIDGKRWKATPCNVCINGGSGLEVFFDETINTFGIDGQMSENNKLKTIRIYIPLLIKTNTLSENNFAFYAELNKEFKTNNTYQGTVIITKLDRAKKIISGRFEFTGIDTFNPSDSVKVTEGLFDVKY